MLECVGIALCASLWLALLGGADGAAGEAAAGKSRPGEKGGKDEKSSVPGPKSKPPEAAADKAVEEAGQGLGAFGKLLPLGQKNRDVKIPSFRDGSRSSFIQAATMTRLDGDVMQMERLDIRMFGETEDKDVRMVLRTAIYHMPTEVLSSQERSRISRKDFDLQGDTLIFDTRSRQGKMTGHIHMIIRDASSFRRQPDQPAASGSKTDEPSKAPEEPTRSIQKK